MLNLNLILQEANNSKALNNFLSAIDHYKRALKLSPNNTKILYELASIHRSLGNKSQAEKYLTNIIKLEPNNTKSHRMLSSLINYRDNEEHLKIMLKIFNSKELNQEGLIDLDFALGKAYEDKLDYEISFKHYKNANDKKHQLLGSNIQNLELHFEQILQTYNKLNFDAKPLKILSEKKIIFICGMQRSGTTLVEQIVSKHRDVYGANELNVLLAAIRNNFLTNFNLDHLKILDKLKKNDNIIEQAYLNKFSKFKINEKNITDKANENFKWIGLIKLFLPNSIILHCERDPSDTCFSIYKNNFNSKNMSWSSKPDHISRYYKLYKKTLKFWNKVCGDFFYNVNYEKLINNSENEIKKIIKNCGLNWDSNCLEFYKNNKTFIGTTSAVQARNPIYSSSISNYSNYKKHIKFF